MNPHPPSQAGFTMVEILLVLGIIALLSVVAFIVFLQVKDASDGQTEAETLTSVIASVRGLYARSSSYAGLDTGTVNQAHIFPRSMNDGNYSALQPIKHGGDGLVEITPWDVDEGRFAIIYRNAPTRLCVKIALNYGKNVDEVIVGGVHVKNLGDIGSNPALTVVECNRVDPVDITFIQK